jgi:hypothetical protein
MKTNLHFIRTAALGFVCCAAFMLPGIATAKSCKDVTIKVDNDFEHDGSAKDIKVVDFDYWDDTEGKWRGENYVGNLVIDFNNGPRTLTTRNLEYVGGESGVIIRVQFKYLTATNGWSETLNAQTAQFTCNGPITKTVTVLPL